MLVQRRGTRLQELSMGVSVSAGTRSARQVLSSLIASAKSCCVQGTPKSGVPREVDYKCTPIDWLLRTGFWGLGLYRGGTGWGYSFASSFVKHFI